MRENRGELDAARKHKLPKLIELEPTSGVSSTATRTASDGRNTIEEMAEAARERGYSYIAITDHSASHGFGNDVQPDELRAQIEHIRGLEVEGITVLAGSEVNIHTDGSLDYEDDLLERARLGDGEHAHVVPDLREGDDRAHDHRDGAPARRRDRPPDGAADRSP